MSDDPESLAENIVEGVRFLTIREIAALSKLTGFRIRTMAGWEREARRQRWDSSGPDCFRGTGAQRAYHMMLLPRALRKALAPPKPDMKAVAAKRREACARARREILTRLEEYQATHGLSRKAAVLAFAGAVKDASRKRMNPLLVQIEGFDLPCTIIRDARGWAGKGKPWLVSPRTLYHWIADANADGALATNPRRAGGRKDSNELQATIRFLCDAPDEYLNVVVSLTGPRLLEAMRRRGYPV
ncbi:hypothetical protein [Albidovulum sp.]|uniref:hypothetical protein n=1 Tax=Albidovulum sp. TaxID=1872424 RepID=UPI0039B93829